MDILRRVVLAVLGLVMVLPAFLYIYIFGGLLRL